MAPLFFPKQFGVPDWKKQTMKSSKQKMVTYILLSSSTSNQTVECPSLKKGSIKQGHTVSTSVDCWTHQMAPLFFPKQFGVPDWKRQTMKSSKQEMVAYILSSSSTSNQTVECPSLKKDLIKTEHTGSNHLHFSKSCHHQLITESYHHYAVVVSLPKLLYYGHF